MMYYKYVIHKGNSPQEIHTAGPYKARFRAVPRDVVHTLWGVPHTGENLPCRGFSACRGVCMTVARSHPATLVPGSGGAVEW